MLNIFNITIKLNFKISILIIGLFCFAITQAYSQINIGSGKIDIDYSNPKEYEIGGITVSGIKYLDTDALIHLSGLKVGDKIIVPGDATTNAIKKLWKQGLFSDVQIKAQKLIDNKIFLEIILTERPRLSMFSFKGIKKSEADDIREHLKLTRGTQVTDNLKTKAKSFIKDYFIDKGFLQAETEIVQKDDTSLANHVILEFIINKNNRIKINEIYFDGNTVIEDAKLRRTMKETKRKTWYNIFKSSKYIEENLKEDKENIIAKYNEKGYRDAKIVYDSTATNDEKTINLYIGIDEGKKYFFRNITWVGNSKYDSKFLSEMLGIKPGDIYDQSVLENKLFVNETSISSLYLDNGYLFFNLTPVEVLVENDSIDLEMRIYEGKQARISKVTIKGNSRTNEHVIRREIRTKPGDLFSRADIIRTQRELAQLGFFNPEKLDVKPKPNPVDGTVDLEYVVEERPSDQIELSGGYGARMFVGTLGLTFNNFSTKRFFKKGAWTPLPSGDGQKLSMRAQTNGKYYQAYSISFIEPWLGGKKPNSLSVSLYKTRQTNGWTVAAEDKKWMNINGASVGLGRRLKWPDDYFTLYHDISFQNYDLNQWSYFMLFPTGKANNISFTTTLSRNSIDQPIYPRKGNSFSLSVQLTPPFSAFRGDVDYAAMNNQEKYRWIEYHKWKFKASWFTNIYERLVLNTRTEFGFKGMYNKKLGHSPFEGFNVGGDGLSGYSMYGVETIGLRGYDHRALTPDASGNLYSKITMELRYPLSLNPNATLYALTFFEAGNAWTDFNEFSPFELKRAAGVGVRIFLPMIGMLGVDWGYGFDDIYNSSGTLVPGKNGSQFAFTIGQQF